MKNVQIIDGANNCSFDIFLMSDDLFDYVFPNGKDIAFIEDIISGSVTDKIDKEFDNMWSRPLNKKNINGIHGTIFYDLYEKSELYPNRMESDLDFSGRAFCLSEANGGGHVS